MRNNSLTNYIRLHQITWSYIVKIIKWASALVPPTPLQRGWVRQYQQVNHHHVPLCIDSIFDILWSYVHIYIYTWILELQEISCRSDCWMKNWSSQEKSTLCIYWRHIKYNHPMFHQDLVGRAVITSQPKNGHSPNIQTSPLYSKPFFPKVSGVGPISSKDVKRTPVS